MFQRLTFCLPIVYALSLLACGSNSPTAPTPVIANYAGNWNGTYSITGCTQSGQVALANVCQLVGQTPRFTLALTQSGSNVAGTFTLGNISFPQTGGTVGADSSLALNATSISNGITVVVGWNLRLVNNSLSGTLSQNWTSTGLSGSATVSGTVVSAVR